MTGPFFGFIKKRWASCLLAAVLMVMPVYRGVVFVYPAQKPNRNALDYACDVVGYSYHYLMLAFDATHAGLRSDYHARRALQYKPGCAFMKQYVPPGLAGQ